MQRLLVFRSDNLQFDREVIQALFETEDGFRGLRHREPGGAVIEAEFVQGEDSTIARLSSDLETISLSGASDAALRVVLLLGSRQDQPLRIIDTDYSFDLTLGDYANVEELRAAIDTAQAS